MQAVLAQDPECGILCYGDTMVRHENQDEVALEFLDFYHSNPKVDRNIKCLVFDSKFTTYANLAELNERGVKFITIQRRSKNLEAKIASTPAEKWKDIRIERANGRHRNVTLSEDTASLKGYGGSVRQIFIKKKYGVRPAVIITNDLNSAVEQIVRKYAMRWMVEKETSEHIHFFHLNRNSSGIVVKVDFDLTMTLLAHNLYRLLVRNFAGYSHCEAATVFDKFVNNAGTVCFSAGHAVVKLKRKRHLSYILESMPKYAALTYPWLGGKKLLFEASTTT
jgi:hypothetical protein